MSSDVSFQSIAFTGWYPLRAPSDLASRDAPERYRFECFIYLWLAAFERALIDARDGEYPQPNSDCGGAGQHSPYGRKILAIIIARVENEDLGAWYAEHMKAIPAFKDAGVISEVMYSDRNQPNARVGILEVEDVDRFFDFLSRATGPRHYRPMLWVLDEIQRTI